MELDLPPSPATPGHVSVKEAVLPFGRFPRADSLLGPEMKSTGEVMGVASDYPTAFGKAQAAAGAELPTAGTVFISVTDGDKPAATQLAASLHDLGFAILATGGTAQAIRRMGVPVERIRRSREGSPNVVEPDRGGRGRPRHQHADGLGRPRRRLRDPPRRGGARHPLHHHDERAPAPPSARSARCAAASPTVTLAPGAARGRAAARSGGRRRERPSAARWRPPERRVARGHGGASGWAPTELISAAMPAAPPIPSPGQFYMLAAAERWGGGSGERPYLPRAFSFARASAREGGGVELEFLLEDVGPGHRAPGAS